MNKFILSILSVVSFTTSFGQIVEKTNVKFDKKGFVKSMDFSSSEKKVSMNNQETFFNDILKKKTDDTFVPNTKIKRSDSHASTLQYYKGIKVEGAGYNLHYNDSGTLQYVNGKYVDCSGVDVVPVITEQRAIQAFAAFLNIPKDSGNEYSAELLIKEIKTGNKTSTPLLVYKVFAVSGDAVPNVIGYIDAHTGRVAETENSTSNVTATFSTYYLGVKYAQTKSYNDGYRLYDDSHSAVIHTRNLSGYAFNQTGYATEITDANNIWAASELGNNRYALDVHWALQKIYERLYNTHNKNSFDNLGHAINAYINPSYALGNENAKWNNSQKNFTFGNGVNSNDGEGPMGTLDIVAHEYGHAITSYQIGWSSSESYLNEGLSDVWAAILEYRIDPNAQEWKIGEKRFSNSFFNCLRNMASPSDTYACKKTTDAYDSYDYQNPDQNVGEEYVRSGVFSHWFYLLVEGGSGYNSCGTYYYTPSVGMDIAENLIVKAVFDGYLAYTESYEDVRNAFIQAATAMGNSNLVACVKDAWHAVGVGECDSPVISGPNVMSGISGEYYIANLPGDVSVSYYLDASNSCYPESNVTVYNNTPTNNHCTVYNYGGVAFTRMIFANIYHNGNLIKTSSPKTILGDGSLIAFFWEDTNDPYLIKNIIAEEDNYVTPGSLVYIQSDAFIGKTVHYYSSSGSGYLYPSGGVISFDMPYLPSGGTVYFTVSGGGSSTQYNFKLQSNGGNNYNANSPLQIRLLNRQQLSLSISNREDDTDNLLKTQDLNKKDFLCQYEIYNSMTMKKILQGEFEREGVILNVSTLSPGLYIIKVQAGNNKYTSKIVIK